MARWIADTEAERARLLAFRRAEPQPPGLSNDRKETIYAVNILSDVLGVLRQASAADKAAIYGQVGLRLVYRPDHWIVRAEAHLTATPHWHFESIRGGLEPTGYGMLAQARKAL